MPLEHIKKMDGGELILRKLMKLIYRKMPQLFQLLKN
jgi:hypothetical protein